VTDIIETSNDTDWHLTPKGVLKSSQLGLDKRRSIVLRSRRIDTSGPRVDAGGRLGGAPRRQLRTERRLRAFGSARLPAVADAARWDTRTRLLDTPPVRRSVLVRPCRPARCVGYAGEDRGGVVGLRPDAGSVDRSETGLVIESALVLRNEQSVSSTA
jgi:hypothetical protein